MMILIAGPYRSGTDDDPVLIEQNVQAMAQKALEIYRMGHLPVLGEWFALPLVHTAGSAEIGDQVYNELFHPVALRLIGFCDAVLRIGGPSQGADEMVAAGLAHGKQILYSTEGLAENWPD